MLENMVIFAVAFAASAATPGPDTMSIFGKALGGGRGAAVPFVVGIILGKLILLTLAVLGLAAIAQALGPLFVAIKLGGAAYLVWMGLRLWCRPSNTDPAEVVTTNASWKDTFTGLALGCSNPHAIIFYVALLPAIVEMQELNLATYLMLCSILVTLMAAIAVVYILLADRMRRLFRSKRASRIRDRVAGTIAIGSGVVVATR